jgi:hypothetical protein
LLNYKNAAFRGGVFRCGGLVKVVGDMRLAGVVCVGVFLSSAGALWAQASDDPPYEGVYGLQDVPGMDCATNPLSLNKMDGKGGVLMEWRDPVPQLDGAVSGKEQFLIANFDGTRLYLSNFRNRDMPLLRFSDDMSRFDFFADWRTHWNEADEPFVTYVRCDLLGS